MAGGPGVRRWPPAVAVVTGFLMVFVALPNPLKIPNNNPGATAELAPVPGDDEVDAPGNFGETGLATSNSLGSLDGGPPPPPPQGGREVPIDKDCIEGRQTEDPLSPPCVPYFNGDNKGATWEGVTASEISIVFYNDSGVNGDMTEPYKPEDDQGAVHYEDVNLVKTIKYQLRYFQDRFQTYGRNVRVWASASSGGRSGNEAGRRRDALRDAFKFNPFASVYLGDNAQEYFSQLAEYRIPTFGLNFDVPRSYYVDKAPYVWSFVSDQETEVGWSASFICRVLLGRDGPGNERLPARFARGADIQNQPRKIGFIWHKNSARGTEKDEMSALMKRNLKDECGYTFDAERSFSGGTGAGASDAPGIMAEFKRAGITTILCYCTPVPTEQSVSAMQSAASTADYHPEWYWDHASAMDRPVWQQAFGSKEQPGFGVTYFWRQPAFREQMHYRAYQKATKDGSVPNVRFNFSIYHLYLNLFTALQAAGPELNPETVQRGMFTFQFLKPSYPWLPTGSFGHSGPGPYTFLDTAMAWWWDPTGTPPGGKEREGCMRVANEGQRYAGPEGVRAGMAPAWPIGDDFIAEARDRGPCSEDTRKIQDPQPGDI